MRGEKKKKKKKEEKINDIQTQAIHKMQVW